MRCDPSVCNPTRGTADRLTVAGRCWLRQESCANALLSPGRSHVLYKPNEILDGAHGVLVPDTECFSEPLIALQR